MTQLETVDKTYKAGEVIYRQGELNMTMYDILWGRVAVYVDYGLPTQMLLNEVGDDGFIGMVGFWSPASRTPRRWPWRRQRSASLPVTISAATFRNVPPRS